MKINARAEETINKCVNELGLKCEVRSIKLYKGTAYAGSVYFSRDDKPVYIEPVPDDSETIVTGDEMDEINELCTKLYRQYTKTDINRRGIKR